MEEQNEIIDELIENIDDINIDVNTTNKLQRKPNQHMGNIIALIISYPKLKQKMKGI
jgi:predicted DNA-binding protein